MIRNVNPKLLREPRHWGRRDRQVLALTVLTILLWMIIMYLALLSGEQSIGLFPLLRYGAVIPVAVTAYYYGVGAGVTVALFFNSAFWMELYALSLRSGLSLITPAPRVPSAQTAPPWVTRTRCAPRASRPAAASGAL